MVRFLPFLFLLAACDKEETPTETGEPSPSCTAAWQLDDLRFEGAAPWDGISLDARSCVGTWDEEDGVCKVAGDCGSPQSTPPLVVDATGTPVVLVLREPPYTSSPAYVAEGGFPPGTYKVVGADQVDMGWNEGFKVDPIGVDPAFDPSVLEGRTWLLDSTSVDGGAVETVFEASPHTHYYLQVEPRADGRADFEIRLKNDEKADDPWYCRLLVGTGTLSETGEFLWTTESLTLDSKPPIQAYDVSIHLGFAADGSAVGGLQAKMLADTWELSSWAYEDHDTGGLCELAQSLGGDPCQPCPDAGAHPTCNPIAIYGATMAQSAEVFPEELEDCSVLWSDADFSCELGCAAAGGRSTAWGTAILAGLAALVRRRRR